MKRCTKCARDLPPDAFAKWRASCRDCEAAWQAAYRAANREKIAAQQAARYAANRARILAQQAAYRAAAPHAGWADTYRRRVQRLGLLPLVADFTRADVVGRYGDWCFHCGGPFEELDHWPIPVRDGGPHTLDNVRPSCTRCNRRGNGRRAAS